jgi:AcrR family transcriptional regulator
MPVTPIPLASLSSPRRGRPPTAGLRESILRAAERVFTRHDYHEVLMDDVAQACGVGKGTLYRYFPSKRFLYLAVMFEGIERLRDDLQVAVGAATTPARKIERLVRCILEHFWGRRFFFALIHRNEYKPADPDFREWLRRRTEIARLVQRTVRRAQAAGHVRRIEPRIAAEMLLGMLRGVNRYRTRNDDLDDLVAAVVEVFLCGVATPAGRRVAAKADKGD